MVFRFAIYVTLVLATTTNAPLLSAKINCSLEEVDIQCTSVSLEYLTDGKIKKTSSENCTEKKKHQDLEAEQVECEPISQEARTE